MPPRIISPSVEEARKILDALWAKVNSDDANATDHRFDQLIDCNSVSIRFCLPTQILGKLTDPKLDTLCLQKGDGSVDSMWDPRGFAAKVIVPWVMQNQNVLGTSADPYVSLPLRRPRLEIPAAKVKNKAEWILLCEILVELELSNDPKLTEKAMLLTLSSIKRKLAASTFEYVIPERISLNQTRQIIKEFLSEGSGGDRGLSVAAALFTTIGKIFTLYSKVTRYVINASDTSTGSTGDIECFDHNGDLRLAIEVKERNLTLTDVKSGIVKARKGSLQELLFNSPSIRPDDVDEVEGLVNKAWASGTNIYQLSIDELTSVALTLTGEQGRRDFLENVGLQLNEFNTQPKNRQRWKELLEDV